MSYNDLSFKQLNGANVARCVVDFEHPLDSWSLLEWAGAMAGEVGEAANVAKKLRRVTTPGQTATWHSPDEQKLLLAKLADELADVVIYADLVAAAAGINLSDAIREKFNRDSDKHGSKIKLWGEVVQHYPLPDREEPR